MIYALLTAGVQRIFLHNRTLERAHHLQQEFGSSVEAKSWDAAEDALAHVDMLVNATSLGMRGEEQLSWDLRGLWSGAIVVDLVYVPLRTELIQRALLRGLRAVTGLGMLLHQATPGFERWFGVRPEVTTELREIIEADILGAEKPGA